MGAPCELHCSYIPMHLFVLHFIEPRATQANAINTAVMFQKEWTCEVISKGIRHLISAVYGFVCGWRVGKGLWGFGEVTKCHYLSGVGGGSWHISNEFTFLYIRQRIVLSENKENTTGYYSKNMSSYSFHNKQPVNLFAHCKCLFLMFNTIICISESAHGELKTVVWMYAIM